MTVFSFINIHFLTLNNMVLLSKSYNEAYEILERIANNNYQWLSTRQSTIRGPAGAYNIDALTALSAQVTSLKYMVKAMTNAPVFINQVVEVSCVYCGEGHLLTIVLKIQLQSIVWAALIDRTRKIHIQTLTILDGDST